MSRSGRKKVALGFVALAILASGFTVFKLAGGASAQMPGGEMPAMPVPIVIIEDKPIQIWKEFSGRLNAVDYVEVRPQVSGLIQKIHFQDGQLVKKGDLLFTIDPRPYEAAMAQAKADASTAWNEVQYAKKEMARAEELLSTGAISKQGYEQRMNALKVNQGNSAAAAARIKQAEVDLDHATIESPIDGRVGRPEITEGNLVNPTANLVLTTIVSDKDIYADFEVDEQTYLAFVRAKTGQDLLQEQAIPVRLFLNKDDKEYTGTIKSFDNRISASSGTIRARATFSNEDGALLPGMFARVQIGSSGQENKITITEKAILTDQNRKFVYVVGQDNAATYREIKPGDSVGRERIILSGLAAGDKVIVDGLMKLRPGAKVQPMTAQEMEAMKKQMAAQQQGGAGEVPAQEEAKTAEEPAPEAEQPVAEEAPVEQQPAPEASQE